MSNRISDKMVEISAKYKSAIKLVDEVESDLDNISNEIEIINKDFSQE